MHWSAAALSMPPWKIQVLHSPEASSPAIHPSLSIPLKCTRSRCREYFIYFITVIIFTNHQERERGTRKGRESNLQCALFFCPCGSCRISAMDGVEMDVNTEGWCSSWLPWADVPGSLPKINCTLFLWFNWAQLYRTITSCYYIGGLNSLVIKGITERDLYKEEEGLSLLVMVL